MTAAPPESSTWMNKRTRQHALYPRQKEALGFYATGMTYVEVAEEMGVKVGTARSYIGAAVVALGADGPTDAVRIARQRGEID